MLILDEGPIVSPILNDLILCCVIRIFRDSSRKLGVICIYTGIYDSNCDSLSVIVIPEILHIDIIQVCLQSIIRIAYGIIRTHGKAGGVLLFLNVSYSYLIVCGHFFKILSVFIDRPDVLDRYTFGQGKSCISSVLRNTQFRAEKSSQFLCSRL